MKKAISLALVAIMSLCLFAGCSDPLYDEFEKFLNEDMVDVNANYEVIKEQAGSWANMETVEEMVASIKDNIMPTVEDSLDKLSKIELQTEEVKALKDKYVEMMEAYKAGFADVLAGLEANDTDLATSGNEKINEGIALLDEYNAGLEALAEQVGAEIEY